MSPIVWSIILMAIVLFVVITGFAYTTLYERKVLGRLQDRYGPNRVGPFGLLQPAADGLKLFMKEELMPLEADKVLFVLAPVITVIPALVIFAVIPFGKAINLFGQELPLTIAPGVNVAMLYVMAITSISVYGIVLAGWSSNNKYSMLGGLRSSAQMISYELTMGLSIVPPLMLAGSMDLGVVVEKQANVWFVFLQPIAAIIFMIAVLAEVNRAPFDLPEAEQELTAGYHTEYSGMKFALFYMAEYIKMIAVSALAITLFFGGYRGPFVDQVPILGPVYFIVKVLIALFIMIWVRATLPRIRYDRLMAFGWKIALPLALANVMVTGIVIVLHPYLSALLSGLVKALWG